ncbi:SrfA family protein [Thorsellia anophelis]|uniref:Virulence factor n=1 Tax=Thorsellia anophelis DSM 18579 TaxID=1123402 RepID=A0A1H9ZQT7_9GAMM|nr:SrfA family protein [Thorsellia anophelis]SES84058.1 hypothetical protein SAMN02583745_00654 [Thorsellia anophelis DSM 18579]
MNKILLRSHSLNDFQPIGEHGKPVYQSAIQLRETLRLRGRLRASESLAIPQMNEAGDRIDWYSAFPGNVVPWSSASESERSMALLQLEKIHEELIEVSEALLGSEKKEQALFASLLQKARQFPDSTHIYLVDGRPVVTFWGFLNNLESIRFNPLDCLASPPVKSPLAATPPPVVDEPLIIKRTNWFWWLLLLLLLLLLLIGGYFLYKHLTAPDLTMPSPTLTTPDITIPDTNLPDIKVPELELPEVQLPDVTLPEVIVPDGSLPNISLPNVTLPEIGVGEGTINQLTGQETTSQNLDETNRSAPEQAEENSTSADDNSSNEAQSEDTTPPQQQDESKADPKEESTSEPANQTPPELGASDGETEGESSSKEGEAPPMQGEQQKPEEAIPTEQPKPLSIPESAKATEGTDFLNGAWKATGGIQDAKTGKPLALTYDFKEGAGKAQVTRSDGVVCEGTVSAGLKSGELGINNQSVANCTDGSTYSLPEIVCTQEGGVNATCKGQYENGTNFPINMKTTTN